MKKLVLTSPALANSRVELTGDQLPVVLGRSKQVDITIQDELLSRQHSEIRLNDFGQFEIHDMDSTNLTIVNGHDITCHVLQTGDRIFLGDTEIAVEVIASQTEEFSEQTTREIPALPEEDEA